MITKFITVYFCIFSLNVHALSSRKINEWYNSLNMSGGSYSNRTGASVIKGQSASYYTAGSYVERNKIVSFPKIVTVQSPKMSAGCGGIDLYLGGLETINADKFRKLLRAIAQNSKTMAFMLALKVVSPVIENTINEIQHFANKYLKMNLDSCKAAQNLVGGAMEYMGKKNANCIVKKIEKDGVSWQKAEEMCGNGGQMSTIEGKAANRISFVKGNIAWYVLMEDPYFSNDLEFSELIMNITGTLIITGSDAGDFKEIPSAIKNNFSSDRFENIYNALLRGKKLAGKQHLQLYTCKDRVKDRNACSRISDSLKAVETNFDGLETKIQIIIKSISDKIYRDEKLDSVEKGLISSTSIPIYKLLISAAGALPNSNISLSVGNDYSRLIAEDILLKSLGSVLSKVDLLASNAKNIKGSDELKKFQNNLISAMNGLERKRLNVRRTIEQKMELMARIQRYEKMIIGKLSSNIINNLNWSSL